MKLVIAIVRDQDAGRVIDALVAREYRSTRINTAGGFLKRGNATLLVGVESEQVDDVIDTIRANCGKPSATPAPGALGAGAGVLFVLPVSGFLKV